MPKPFSQACENNKDPILRVLKDHLMDVAHVLEVGSGTGQHAVHFGCHLPHLTWQATDRPQAMPAAALWIREAALPNVPAPLELDVLRTPWPIERTGALFSANTVHIMGWPGVQALIAGAGRILEPGGVLCLYGPFKYQGSYTSESNARFDLWLQQRDPQSGIRAFEDVDVLASDAGLSLVEDRAMPANNRTLVWKKAPAAQPAPPG